MRKKNLTVGVLLDRLNDYLQKGELTRDTPVCGYSDTVFECFYPIKEDARIVVDPAPWIKENLDYVRRHKDRAPRGDTIIKIKKKAAAEMKRLGKAFVCLNNLD